MSGRKEKIQIVGESVSWIGAQSIRTRQSLFFSFANLLYSHQVSKNNINIFIIFEKA
jgi:hypothetical protein